MLHVKRRKYRFRFLDVSVSRIYEFKLMSSTQGPKSAASLGYNGDELQGQYRIEDGQRCRSGTQIASDGGLLPFPITRDSLELWPAKRREFIVDFTKYQDGTPTTKGDVIYLTNVMKMGDGRMWDTSSRDGLDPKYKVPMMKIVIGDSAPDASEIPTRMRALPPLPKNWRSLLDNRMILRGRARQRRRRGRVAHQRRAVHPETVARSLKNPRGKSPLASREGQLHGDPQRRRRRLHRSTCT